MVPPSLTRQIMEKQLYGQILVDKMPPLIEGTFDYNEAIVGKRGLAVGDDCAANGNERAKHGTRQCKKKLLPTTCISNNLSWPSSSFPRALIYCLSGLGLRRRNSITLYFIHPPCTSHPTRKLRPSWFQNNLLP